MFTAAATTAFSLLSVVHWNPAFMVKASNLSCANSFDTNWWARGCHLTLDVAPAAVLRSANHWQDEGFTFPPGCIQLYLEEDEYFLQAATACFRPLAVVHVTAVRESIMPPT